ncbi:MAG TPA: hypothetical protein IGS17_13080, partial [Oscillatoriales cyanobacterium M59_W2019_021]
MNFEPEERSSNALEEGEEQPPILPPPDAELEPVPEASLTESPRRFPNLMVWGAILATVALAGGIGFWQGRQSQNVTAEASASEKPRAVPVKFVTVEPSEIEEASEFVGTLEAAKTATLRSQV